MPTLVPGTYPGFIEGYLRFVDADKVSEAIDKYSKDIVTFFAAIPQEKISYRYAPGKWNLQEMLQHLIDAERIFAYRALRISRRDRTPLPGFDENSYALAADADARNWQDLLQEFEAVRRSTDLLLQSFTQEQLEYSGTTNGEPNTVKALSFLVFGHILHHIDIIKSKYL